MKRSFRKVSPLGFMMSFSCSGGSLKIMIAAGFLLFSFVSYELGFAQTLNNFKPGSEPDGFGKIHWGVDILTLSDMEHSRKDPSYGGIDIYRKKGDDSWLCGVAVKNIEYLFWKGRFCGIIFFQEGFSGYEKFRDAAAKEFGLGKKPFGDQEYYLWEGEKALVALEYNPVGKKVLFWMLGISILRQMEQGGQ